MSDNSKNEILSAIQKLNEKMDRIEDSQNKILLKQNQLISRIFQHADNKGIMESISAGVAETVAFHAERKKANEYFERTGKSPFPV